MTKPLYTAAPVTDREAPALWADCQGCGEAAALPASMLPGNTLNYCPACTARALLRDAATQQLANMLAPHLGAWGNFYAAAGLPLEELQEITAQLSASWAAEEYSTRYQTAVIYKAMRAHPTPLNVTRAQPDRVELDMLTLPRITAAYQIDRSFPAAEGSEPDRRWAFSLAYPDGSTAEGVVFGPGRDAVLIYPSGPQADAVLYFTGMHGLTDTTAPRYASDARALAVPAQFLKYVRDSLGYWGSADTAAAGGAQ